MLLNCHTYFSLCYGTLSAEQLIDEVREKGYDRFVLSDINNTSAILDALRTTTEKGPQVIPGIDFRNGTQQQFIGIAKNNQGLMELNEYLTRHLHSKTAIPPQAPAFKNAYVIYPFATYKDQLLSENTFIGISVKELQQLPFSKLKNQCHKMVVLQTLSFLHKKHFNAHRLLRAIDTNTLLSKLSPNEQGLPEHTSWQKKDLYAAFGNYPEIIYNTEALLGTCSVQFKFGKLANKNRKYYYDSLEADMSKLKQLCREGLKYRYPKPTYPVYRRILKELEIIKQKQFASYYLINWDITSYARKQNYFYVGRGSGANSVVAYLLRITDVDPIDLDLYFERFINMYRANAPDFDIDFSWADRDDVTRYIFERFGSDKTALLATYATFQKDAVTRELGKVFGLPADEINKLQKVKDVKDTDQMGKLVLKYSALIQGFPSHLSIHASGIIISEEPVSTYTATFLPPKGYPTTQFSMQEAEDIGLFKFDILSQRGLGKIKDAVALVKKNKGIEIDIHDINRFKHDEEIKKLLSIGKCIGCFYVESPAMRMLLAKLRADDYLRLVAASSIIRPGVSKSGMMREFILRYRDEARRTAARAQLPELYDLLEETYGVMVYQEDVIKIAHFFAGLSLADADYLRRGMSWKFKQRSEFDLVEQKFFSNCTARGYPLKTIQDTWNQIESFANFAFSKGHSASYAVESYQALFLKAYYPLEYMTATLNNGGGFYRTELYIHEARLNGAEIIPPCVNNSGLLCEIKGTRIYLGFGMINELEKSMAETIVLQREKFGEYNGLYDLVKRTKISIEQLQILIRAGAFESFKKNKKELLWEAYMLINPLKTKVQHADLFDIEPETYQLPKLENTWLDDAMDEYELLGFPLCSPFKLLKDEIKNKLLSADLKQSVGKNVEIVGYLVNVKTTWAANGEKMFFGTFLDLQGQWLDTVHFPAVAKFFTFKGPGCYRIIGKVTEEFDFICIDVTHLYHLPIWNKDETPTKRLKPGTAQA